MTIEELKKKKREAGYTYSEMAELSGVPLGTIQKIFSGETVNPRYDTMQALESIFEESAVVREAAEYIVRRQGGYTIEDYYALPDDQRVELIDGYFYDMASPNNLHQEIIGDIFFQIQEFIKKNKGKCKAYISPLDVCLDCDDRTILQPDVMVICDNTKQRKWGVMGAPDFVLEVISKSTKKKDYTIKVGKYMNAKVKEYWIIDPYKKTLVKFDYENEIGTTLCTLDKPVPMKIFDGKLEIKFDEILQMIEEFEGLEE